MSNSKNSNLEDVSKGNDESAPRENDSTSNKKTRFTKSKSISEVFKELEIEGNEENAAFSDDLDGSSADEIVPVHDSREEEFDVYYEDEFQNSSEEFVEDFEEIIPIHNEYRDLDKSEALTEDSVEGGVILNPDSDDMAEADVNKSIEFKIDEKENDGPISGEADSDEFEETISVKTDFDDSGESIDGAKENDEDAFITKDSDVALADDDIEEKIGKSSAQGVLINDKDKSADEDTSFDIFNSSTIISIVGFIVGFIILLIGITYYASSSDRVVDNVLSGETAGLAIFVIIIGLMIIGFSLLKFFSSTRSSLIIDTFNSIKSIDYDDISEDVISREDFDTLFSIFKRKKDTDFSDDDDKSVDSSKDLFEKNQDDVSDDDIDAFYSDSNLTSQKNQSSSKGHADANSTDIPQDYDDGLDEIIPIHSKLNEQSDDESLEDKYSKYDFDDEYEEDYIQVDDSRDDFIEEEPIEEDFAEMAYEGPVEEEYEEEIEYDSFEEDADSSSFEENVDSNFEAEKMDVLEDKYAKYDFDEDEEGLSPSKPEFKKSVDLSKFEKQELTEEELAERERKAAEFEEKKRRIIEGTNFDNSLRKH